MTTTTFLLFYSLAGLITQSINARNGESQLKYRVIAFFIWPLMVIGGLFVRQMEKRREKRE
jgi:hypothetical protein